MEKESQIPKEISVSTIQSVVSRDFNDEFTIIAIEDCMTVPSLTSKLHKKKLGKKRPLHGNISKSVDFGSVITEEDPTAAGDGARDCVRVKYLVIALSVLLSAIAVAVVIWVGVIVARSNQTKASSENSGSSASLNSGIYNPQQTASAENNARYTQMYSRVREISDESDLQENSDTPQRQALEWLVSGDPTGVMPDDDTFLLRYALTVLYYSFHGPDWYSNDAWLTESNLCAWLGVDCSVKTSYDSTGKVISKYEITGLSLGNMNLAGTIPLEISSISSLQNIDFSQNRISGTIPSSLGLDVNLVNLNLSKNQLKGSIPETLGSLSQLESLQLNDNILEGGVLRALSLIDRIRVLRLEHNNLSGIIPTNICASAIPNKDLMVDCEVSCSCCNSTCT